MPIPGYGRDDAARIVAAGAHRRSGQGLSFARLTAPQAEFCGDDSPIALWRDGNGLGKSFALAKMAIDTCRGTSAERRKYKHRPPVQVVVVGVSRAQMYPLHEKIDALLPTVEISESYEFVRGRGIKGNPPFVTFEAGPGRGSEIHFRTYGQGANVLAGIHPALVILDEPPPEAMFGEVQGRVGISRGEIRIGMTPTPDMPDVGYLRELVRKREVSEHNHHLAEANCWPRGNPAPWIYQAEIDAYSRALLPIQRRMRTEGHWEPSIEGLYVPDFDPARHLRDERPPPGATVFVGLDHGEMPGKQAMVLGAGTGLHTSTPRIWAIDEVRNIGIRTTTERDARDLFAMLLRNGLELGNVDLFVGDRSTKNGRIDAAKSNRDLRFALADLLNQRIDEVPRIVTPIKGAGSVIYGCEKINILAMRDALVVHPRCIHLAGALQRFAGDPRDPCKDVLDAFRYPVERAIRRSLATIEARY